LLPDGGDMVGYFFLFGKGVTTIKIDFSASGLISGITPPLLFLNISDCPD